MADFPLRPLGVGELLDGAFALYRRHLRAFLLASAIPQLPVPAALLLITWWVGDPEVADPGRVALGDLGGMLVLLVGCVLPSAAATRLGADAYLGRPVVWREALRVGVRRFLPTLGAVLVCTVATLTLAVFCLVPGAIAMTILFAVVPLVVLERQGVVQALSRSQDLAEGSWGRIFLVQAVLFTITLAPELGVVWLAEEAGAALGGGPAVTVVSSLAASLSTMVTLPLAAIGTMLQYYDQRLRRDPLEADVEQDAQPAPI